MRLSSWCLLILDFSYFNIIKGLSWQNYVQVHERNANLGAVLDQTKTFILIKNVVLLNSYQCIDKLKQGL